MGPGWFEGQARRCTKQGQHSDVARLLETRGGAKTVRASEFATLFASRTRLSVRLTMILCHMVLAFFLSMFAAISCGTSLRGYQQAHDSGLGNSARFCGGRHRALRRACWQLIACAHAWFVLSMTITLLGLPERVAFCICSARPSSMAAVCATASARSTLVSAGVLWSHCNGNLTHFTTLQLQDKPSMRKQAANSRAQNREQGSTEQQQDCTRADGRHVFAALELSERAFYCPGSALHYRLAQSQNSCGHQIEGQQICVVKTR